MNQGMRRQMIEQAAGISKYKIRKKETLSKLRSTTEDLDRVQDLLFEIEKNMASFERQAKRTERFNTLKLDYKELSIKISHIEVKELNLKYRELEEKITREKDDRLKLNTQLTSDNSLLEKLKTDILEHEKSLSVDQQAFNQLIEHLGKIENDKNLSLQKIQNAKDRIIEVDASAQQLNESIKTGNDNLEKAQKILADSNIELEQSESNFNVVDEEFQQKSTAYNELREKEKVIKAALSNRQLAKESLGREVEAMSTKSSILEKSIEVVTQRVGALKENRTQVDKEFAQQQSVIRQGQEELTSLEQKMGRSDEILEQFNLEISKAQKSKNEAEVEISTIEQRISFLQNIIENNEGVPEAAKFILTQNKGKLQTISDVIEVSDERYTKIVELYLEPYFHHILVDTKSEAYKLYEKVRNAQKGKIRIAVLEDLPLLSAMADYQKLIPLAHVIKVAEKYRPIVDLICKDAFISNEPYGNFKDDALRKKIVLFPEEYLIVADGQMYGGSKTLFEGVQLGRKKLLENLVKKIGELKTEFEKKDAEVTEILGNIENHKKELQVERIAISEYRGKMDAEKSKLYEIQGRLQNIDNNIQSLSNELEEKSVELNTTNESLGKKQLQYEELSGEQDQEYNDEELAIQLEEMHAAYIAASGKRDEVQSQLFNARSKMNIAKKDVEFYTTNIKSVTQRISELKEDKQTQEDILKNTKIALDQIKDNLQVKYSEKKELQNKLSAYEDTYYKEKGRIFELEKGISEIRNKVYSKDQLIISLNEKYTNIGFEIKGIHERNSIEFGIEIKETEFPEEYEGEDLGQLKAKKSKIQDRIRSFGEINPMAITAYNEIKERHDVISKERDDIMEAKASLEETISEIEKTASELFNKALDDIRVNFKKVFQSLFSDDDDCDIVLLDSDDPLEAKIEIVAKPKGKRPKSINQLSGGEKTLTASSFLFALYLLKPAPFCIFDEVDAPLDDVNVLKFNKLIREFSNDSQFIIITHNKLTMQEVDILYGVYLKEQGVSGLSAVDFRTYDQTEMAVAN